MCNKNIFLIFFLSFLKIGLSSNIITAEEFKVIPLPKQIKQMKGNPFKLSSSTKIIYQENDSSLKRISNYLSQYIKDKTNITLQTTSKIPKKKKNLILLSYDSRLQKEEYKITINQNLIIISSSSPNGIFYGCQTLRKSLPIINQKIKNENIQNNQNNKKKPILKIQIYPIIILDKPKFKYRSIMLDCSRHYFPISTIKKVIDILSLHNMNNLHWHLTDDQGWRIEIKKYPLLTEIGSIRNNSYIGRNTQIEQTKYGGFYTQEDIKDLINYASDHFISITPEIDLPGHTLSILASYPNLGCTNGNYTVSEYFGIFSEILCAGKDDTFIFINNIFNEMLEIFPHEYIHIGGDEVPKNIWLNCQLCNKRMIDENITDIEHLQGYFSLRVGNYLTDKGKRIIGWDEIIDSPISKDAIIMSWRGIGNGENAAQMGHEVIMSPMSNMYLDYSQVINDWAQPRTIGGFVSVKRIYDFNPYGNIINKSLVIGVQGNLWSEYVFSEEGVMYQLLPRLTALGEVQWGKEKSNFYEFGQRVRKFVLIYDLYDYKYERKFWYESEM